MQHELHQSDVIARVCKSPGFKKSLKNLDLGQHVVFDHVCNAGLGITVAALIHHADHTKRIWIIAPHLRAQENIAIQLQAWGLHGIDFLPEKEILLGEAQANPETQSKRLQVLNRLAHPPKEQHIILLSKKSLDDEIPAVDRLQKEGLFFQVGDEINLEQLVEKLTAAGFIRQTQVIARGQWSQRGGILDVYPLQSSYPLRFELFDQEIESIREFDVDTQISFKKLTHAQLILDESPDQNLLRYCISSDDLTIGLPFCGESFKANILHAPDDEISYNDGQEDFSTAIYEHPLGNFEAGDFVMQEVRRERAEKQITQWEQEQWHLGIFCPNQAEKERFSEICAAYPHLASIPFIKGDLPEGFSIPSAKLAILSLSELFGRYQTQRSIRYATQEDKARKARAQASLKEINPGDLIVHMSYGIGKLIGIGVSDDSGDEEMRLLYHGNTILHVPLSQAHLVTKYIGLGNKAPNLSKIGDGKWAKAKKSAERAVADYAAQLLNIQAERNSDSGFSHAPDSKWMWEFESSFPFRETPDQLRAIAQTKADMESSQPMDRLICGDVGFGKTEVAIRAAFKCVTGGKQAAMLVPTTVLAEQHFNNFRARMSEYPIRIEMLSRFSSAAQIRSAIAGLADGSVDIVIGTHRLVSDDVIIKNPGLVIIDEEQRFGVKHKEKFKERFKGIDVLTLSATPIPRTLYIALMGARDMSTIETPPANRLPVQTSVCPYDERIIKQAIERELERGGQVFFLHNRVQTIELMKTKIQALVPNASVVIGHGQMPKDELEKVMRQFVNNKADILLATSIIESGIDIPNANTIIIDRADRFGLADLYQLRGRVGRSGHLAYAYLMLPRSALTTDDARKRVSAIKQYSELGSGFKIAMRDLEIRGAGNLLGTQQSGHIAAIGFDLYCQLLKQSVDQLQGKSIIRKKECTLKADFICFSEAQFGGKSPKEVLGAFIPASYMQDAALRISAYKDLAQAEKPKDLEHIRHNWLDRFGAIPVTAEHLIQTHMLRLYGAKANITHVEIAQQRLMLTRNGDLITLQGKFPRLTQIAPLKKLAEVIDLLKKI